MLVVAARELLFKYLEQEDTVYGICDYFYINSKESANIRRLMSDWPQHSGNDTFPVPHPEQGPATAFVCCNNYLANNQYGDERRNLVRFLLDKLAKYEGGVSLDEVVSKSKKL